MRRSATALRRILAGLTGLALVAGAAACGGASGASGSKEVVKLGVHDATESYLSTWKDLASQQGIDLQVVPITDGNQINQSTVDGKTDINSFQHLFFQAQFNVSTNSDLAPLAANYVFPMSLYSKKYSKVSEIPRGATVLVPEDATNGARALLVLQSAKLIALKAGGSPLSTPRDVLPSSKVKVKAVSSAQVVLGLQDVGAGITTNYYAVSGGLNPKKDGLYNDAKSAKADPYINIFTVRKADVDNPTLKKLVKIYHDSDKIHQQISDENGGVLIDRSDFPQAGLQKILDQLEVEYAKSIGKSYDPGN